MSANPLYLCAAPSRTRPGGFGIIQLILGVEHPLSGLHILRHHRVPDLRGVEASLQRLYLTLQVPQETPHAVQRLNLTPPPVHFLPCALEDVVHGERRRCIGRLVERMLGRDGGLSSF